jgi:hypothetical protein
MSNPTVPDPAADRRRLDWLEAVGDVRLHRWAAWVRDGVSMEADAAVTVFGDELDDEESWHAPTLRAAIDAAMAGWAERGGEAP